MNQHPESKWRAEAYRLTAFFSSNHVDASNWWETVIGEPPENRNLQPKVGTRQEQGSYQGGRLILTVLPGRADWLFLPAIESPTGAPAFDKLPSYDSALGIFLQLAEKWFAISPPLARLAFGTVLDIPVRDRPTGYRHLAEYLHPVKIDFEQSRDFLYQINRRRQSKKISQLMLNRLSKWAVVIAKFSQVEMGPGQIEYIISGDDSFYARLELDMNTDPEYQGKISAEQWPAIFSELVELATEISIEGDIP